MMLEITTGGEALAEYLRSDGCRLEALHLAWNSIRLGSALDIVNSISVNATLTFLDLSYNGLGSDAGELMVSYLFHCSLSHSLSHSLTNSLSLVP